MEFKCKVCGGCCKHIAIEIDTPEDRDDYEDIYWYLLHQNIKVFVTEKDEEDKEDENDTESWFIEFFTKCKELGDDNLCKIHISDRKPKICKEYSPEDCVASDGETEEIASFNNAEEFLSYLKSEKGIILKE